MKFRSILCPVDFSPRSLVALRFAVTLARRSGGRVTVMFVNDPILLAAANAVYRGRRRFVDRTNSELARFVKRATPPGQEREGNIALLVRVGNPAEEILREAKRLRTGIIVMGSHGLSGVQKAFLGSTTEQVLRSARMPVLAIPPSVRSRQVDALGAGVASVIAPIDLAGEWQTDAVRAATIAGQLGSRLLLVRVLAPVRPHPGCNRWFVRTRGGAPRKPEQHSTASEENSFPIFARYRPSWSSATRRAKSCDSRAANGRSSSCPCGEPLVCGA